MDGVSTAQLETTPQPQRVIGRLIGENPGPTLICVASLHGNEPAGLQALQRVFAEIHTLEPELRGQFVGLAGNLAGLAAGKRFIDDDLNRHWSADHVEELKGQPASTRSRVEDRELLALLEQIDRAVEAATGEIYIVDFHTTSGISPPFATIGDTLRNRHFALQFPVPVVLGLEEHLDGTMLEYLNNFGYITMGFEGGQHDDPEAADHIRAAAWIALAAAGVIPDAEQFAPMVRSRLLLSGVSKRLPRVVEVRHRHGITPGSKFEMHSGYRTFQRVTEGEVLGRDALGELAAPEPGRILMPLYQPLGDDGFFLVREFRPFWLGVSTVLRHMHLDALLHWLPGVHRDPDRRDTYIVDQYVARYYALQVFHLLGYRKKRLHGDKLVVSRRRHDFPGT